MPASTQIVRLPSVIADGVSGSGMGNKKARPVRPAGHSQRPEAMFGVTQRGGVFQPGAAGTSINAVDDVAELFDVALAISRLETVVGSGGVVQNVML